MSDTPSSLNISHNKSKNKDHIIIKSYSPTISQNTSFLDSEEKSKIFKVKKIYYD